MPTTSPKPRRTWWPALVIIGAACAFCWPVFAGRIMLPADMCLLMLPWRALADEFPGFARPHNPMFDPIQQYLPWRIYAVESVRSGLLPLWNPYSFCGTPFLANLQSTLLYPLNTLFLITGARHGFGVSAIIHLILGGIFTHAFLRTLGLHRLAALFGALVVMFNGFTVTWLEFPTLSFWVFMWLPGILLCYERSLRAPRSWWPLATALALGVQFLGGHLQVSAYVVLAFGLYAVVRLVRPPAGQGRWAAFPLALAPLAIGIALAAAQIAPTLELAGHAGRIAHGSRGAITTAFPFTHFVLYLVPDFFGNPVHYNYWGLYRDPAAINFFETACYVGILPLLLAVASLGRRREPAFWFFAGLTLFAVLAAVGSPVYMLLYRAVPGFSELAGLARVLCLSAFGLAGLGALGLDELLRSTHARSVLPTLAAAVAAGVLIGLALFGFAPIMAELPQEWEFGAYLTGQLAFSVCLILAAALVISLRSRMRLGAGICGGICIALLLVDLFGHGIRFNPFTDARMAYPPTKSTRWLQEHAGHSRVTSLASPGGLDWMPHNAPLVFGLRDIHGSDSLRVRRSFELVSPPGGNQADYPQPDSPLMDELGVRYLMTRRQLPAPWQLVESADAPIYENPRALPRARILTPDGTPAGGSSVSFERDDPDAILLRVETGGPGMLLLTDSYYPGWRAWVDDEPAEILPARQAFRGIAVPAGEHTVRLRYEPASFRVGLFLSLAALALLAAAAGFLSAMRASASPTAARS